MRVRRAIGYRQHDDRVRIVAVGDESLGAVEHPSALRSRRRHPRTTRIRPRRGLGQPPCAEVLAGGQLRHILLLLRLVSRHINVIRTKGRMRRDNDPDRTVNARKFRDRRDVLHVTHTRAAVFRWENYPHQAELAQFLDRSQGEFAGFIPLHDVRRNLAFGKLANALFKVQLLFVQLEVQVISSLLDATVCSAANFRSLASLGITTDGKCRSRSEFSGWMPRGDGAKNWRPTFYLSTAGSNQRNPRTDRLAWGAPAMTALR